jgi:hypothetical protein
VSKRDFVFGCCVGATAALLVVTLGAIPMFFETILGPALYPSVQPLWFVLLGLGTVSIILLAALKCYEKHISYKASKEKEACGNASREDQC